MLSKITDTNPESEKFQISLIRNASITKRMSIVRSLSNTTIQLPRRAILRSNPKLSEKERNLIFVSLHYDRDIANRLRKYLEQKIDEKP